MEVRSHDIKSEEEMVKWRRNREEEQVSELKNKEQNQAETEDGLARKKRSTVNFRRRKEEITEPGKSACVLKAKQDSFDLGNVLCSLYGRGTSDDKGQVLAILNAIEALQELPVNVKFLLEGMEDVGSQGLPALLEQQNTTFFSDVDYIVVTDTPWLSSKPGITYGTRGNSYFFLEISIIPVVFSGHENYLSKPLQSHLDFFPDSLVDSAGQILIPGIYEAVAPLTEKEKKLYEGNEYDLDQIKAKYGIKHFLYKTKLYDIYIFILEELLLRRSRYPSLSIHGITGAFSAPGTKTVIPAKVIVKFSIRQVPNMKPSVVEKQVTDYLTKKFAERKSSNSVKITHVRGAKPWLSDINNPQFLAARKAIKRVFGKEPDMIRVGGTIPIVTYFEELTGKSIMLLGIGGPDDATHGQDEKISRYNFIEGTKLYAAFLHKLATI
ncbi:cytosolic non-specific dipeptidase-like [Alligator sinensis]|uniref:Cytosolic non-specific dipeptidase-like n=1 Tax=Alligator sinensis TaxID=38654 RepID=A0A3Q0H168_ALLSI|nr:cytosolic non-specific dipeptidase-like [Alligator sinensis]